MVEFELHYAKFLLSAIEETSALSLRVLYISEFWLLLLGNFYNHNWQQYKM